MATKRKETMIDLRRLQKEIYVTAIDKGWHDKELSLPHMIALMYSELLEALEADREGDSIDCHIPDFNAVETELADCIIRILDCAEYLDLDVIGAMLAKIEYNKTRPYKHDKLY